MLRGIPDFLRVFTLPTCTGNIKGLTSSFNCSLQLLIVVIILSLLRRFVKLKPLVRFFALSVRELRSDIFFLYIMMAVLCTHVGPRVWSGRVVEVSVVGLDGGRRGRPGARL